MRKTLPCLLLFITLCGFSPQVASEAQEYNLKAAFLYRFTNYIEWYSLAPEKEFTIGVLGDSPIYDALREIAKTKTVNNKKINVRHFNDLEEIKGCQILFISKNASNSWDEIVVKAKAENMLTISEEEGCAAKGMAINFVLANETLKFEINKTTIDILGLKISSQLLKLAVYVY